jgi:Flp pilus assembly protein TadG
MVTAELAACLPVLALIVAVALAVVTVVDERVRAQDAASAMARAIARGDAATGRRLFAETAPRGASYDVTTSGAQVAVTVRLTVRPLAGWLGSYPLHERVVVAVEPDAPP